MRIAQCFLICFIYSTSLLHAEMVHVIEYLCIDGTNTLYSDSIADTELNYRSSSHPRVSGYDFIEWRAAGNVGLINRDVWGRSKDVVEVRPYEDTELVAHYIPSHQDDDTDGVPDAYELYWYGSLNNDGNSDADGDGISLADEHRMELNPLFKDNIVVPVTLCVVTEAAIFNPSNYLPIVVEDQTVENNTHDCVYLRPQEVFVSPSKNTTGESFACWRVNGVDQRDCLGRAKDRISIVKGDEPLYIVAISEDDYWRRMSLYWYGTPNVSQSSDTDGDGLTFAEELQRSSNPLLADSHIDGPVTCNSDADIYYDANSFSKVVVKVIADGEVLSAVTNNVRAGTGFSITPEAINVDGFAYWTKNGNPVRDEWGRAVINLQFVVAAGEVEVVANCISDPIARLSMFWYGKPGISMSSDTDNDGLTFAKEIELGTSPLFSDNDCSGVVYADSIVHEMNLQPYEQVQGAVVGGAYSQVFTSPIAGNAATSATFGNGGAVWPVVADLNDDGLWDLIVSWEDGVKVFVNVGTKGNPEFEATSDGEGAAATSGVDLAMNSTEKLDALTLDVPPPVDALSATTNSTALLVSDSEGRIWYYKGTQATEATEGTSPASQSLSSLESLSSLSYTLQHKVWGGSRAGFAQGLRLAAVDWDDDGDLDCLAGTADGKLMLLRDPKVGRPTNLKAFAGVDNILLTWDPNQQSRIRGYRVYRKETQATEGTQGTTTDNPLAGYAALVPGVALVSSSLTTQLPTYRDFPPNTDEYAYKVSSVSRFYTAGNSTPTETESPATEAILARTGGVKFFWNDAVAKVGEKVEVMLSIENSMNYNVAGKSQTVVYDPAYLTPVKVVKTGLTEEFDVQCAVVNDGEWQIAIIGAVGGGTPTLPAGGGKFLVLVFEAKKEGTTKVGGETGATVSIAAGAAIAPYQLGDVDGDGDVDVEDLRLLAKLKNGTGRKHTADQLKAGDFNGNGKLDNADYQALREMLKERGEL